MKMLSTIVATLAFASMANAADLPLKAAPPAPIAAPTWTGWYVGINGGGVWGNNDPSLVVSPNGYFIPGNVPAVQAAGSQSFSSSGGLVGGQIGYLAQWGSIIGGVEAGFDWMGLSGSSATGAVYPVQGCVQVAGCAFTLNNSVHTDWLFTFLGRVGVDMGSWFPYITGGLAVSNLKYSVAFADNNLGINANTAASFSDTKAGFAIGGGVEWRFDPSWMLRGEYLYVQFDSVNGTTPALTSLVAAFPATTNYVVSSGTFKENIGRAALSYRF